MPEIHRKSARAYTDDSPDTSNSICHVCYEDNITAYLIPYLMQDGREDKAFRQCPNCSKIISKKTMKHKGEFIALGNTNNSGEPSYEVAQTRRGRQFDRRDNDDMIQDIPKFGNFEDTELKQMVADGAIILSIEDEIGDSDDE